MKHLLDFQNIQKKEMENLIEEILKVDLYKLNQIKSLTLLQFNENSTRTRLSFAIAAKRLGIDIVESTDNISAKSKGEGLMHELETYQSMGIETVVIRSSENNIEDYKSPNQSKFFPTDDFIDSAVKLLINSKNPIIWSGQGVLYSSATEELKELSSLLSLPVITTMPGKSSFDERNPLSLGSANRTAPKTVWRYLGISDTVFAIGSSLTITTVSYTHLTLPTISDV